MQETYGHIPEDSNAAVEPPDVDRAEPMIVQEVQ